MTTLREAAQQALEALEAMQSYAAAERKGLRICDEALAALRAALAQQDEPVLVQGELPPRYVARSPIQAEPLNLTDPAVQKRLAAQWGYVPQRKPLTEEEKRALADKFLSCQPESYEVSGVFDLISAVERAHEIKE